MKAYNESLIPVVLSYQQTVDKGLADSLISYESQGCLLIIGQDEALVDIVVALKERLHVVVLITDSSATVLMPEGFDALRGEILALSGYLGHFDVKIQGQQNPLNLGLLCPGNKARFDLVLDLSQPPQLNMEVTPLGYYAPRGDKAALQQALIELSALVGVFQKPKFFQYNPSLCVHGRFGISGCNRCLEACPADAISSQENSIAVDPYLCQGCSTCILVCPSGAITANLEFQESPLERMQVLLESNSDRSDRCLLLYDREANKILKDAWGAESPLAIIPMELRELASAGIEFWLAALALGVGTVVLLAGRNNSKRSLEELRQQLDHARRILDGMGYDANCLLLIEGVEELDLQQGILPGTAGGTPPKTMAFVALSTKRQIVKKALEHLVSTAPNPQMEVALGPGAPFGSLEIERDSCTLCMGCVKVCPTKALRSEGDETRPQLGFVEGLCVQCGICSAACPEKAVRLVPRLHYDRQLSSNVLILNESPPFHCVSCGRPFTTKAIFDLMNERLKDNPLFQGDGLKKLQQCPDCRARDHIIKPLQQLAAKQKKNENTRRG